MPQILNLTPSASSFVFRKTKPFTRAEFKFKSALSEYASQRILPRLRARTAGKHGANHYTGVNARVGADAVYLEAIMINETEWGGFGFDFARLIPVNGGLYNLYLRKAEDWTRAEFSSVAVASNYFLGGSIYPRASDWIPVTRGKTFEECVKVMEDHPEI